MEYQNAELFELIALGGVGTFGFGVATELGSATILRLTTPSVLIGAGLGAAGLAALGGSLIIAAGFYSLGHMEGYLIPAGQEGREPSEFIIYRGPR